MQVLGFTELAELPTVVSVTTAARAIGVSRSHAYELVKRGEFPCRIIRVGDAYRVPTTDLLRLLGLKEPGTPLT